MIKYICDKCGTEMGEISAYRVYSFSKGKVVTLCLKCLKAHDKALEKADKIFLRRQTMIKFTCSLEHWLWENHKDKFALISLGHIEEFTDEMQQEYLEWCSTEEGRSYLEGGSNYTQR